LFFFFCFFFLRVTNNNNQVDPFHQKGEDKDNRKTEAQSVCAPRQDPEAEKGGRGMEKGVGSRALVETEFACPVGIFALIFAPA